MGGLRHLCRVLIGDRLLKTHRSAIDAWLALLLCVGPLFIIGFGVSTCRFSLVAGAVLILTGLLVGLMIASLSLPCYYELSEGGLRVRCGLMDRMISWNRVRRLELYSSLWSAPALSLKRVKLTLDDGMIMVSPKDRQEFIRDCQSCLGAFAASRSVAVRKSMS